VQDDAGIAAAISSAMVALKKQYYGRGPERDRTFLHGEYVFTVIEGGLTRSEETRVAAGKEALVRGYRLEFQETLGELATTAVEEITRRNVIGYHSQITFDPTRVFEILVLDEPV
jgi:uncharacterized protein YbcI